MQKKLTLNKAWELCLKQWKWIVEQLDKSFTSVSSLKLNWVEDNGLDISQGDCFFCRYDLQHKKGCNTCPGRQVEKTFKCWNREYHYTENPRIFYQKLLSLNKKRLATKTKKRKKK